MNLFPDPRDEPFFDKDNNLYGQNYEALQLQCMVKSFSLLLKQRVKFVVVDINIDVLVIYRTLFTKQLFE